MVQGHRADGWWSQEGWLSPGLWFFLQSKKDISQTEEEEMILAETTRVNSEAFSDVRDGQEFADRWLDLSWCQILRQEGETVV